MGRTVSEKLERKMEEFRKRLKPGLYFFIYDSKKNTMEIEREDYNVESFRYRFGVTFGLVEDEKHFGGELNRTSDGFRREFEKLLESTTRGRLVTKVFILETEGEKMVL